MNAPRDVAEAFTVWGIGDERLERDMRQALDEVKRLATPLQARAAVTQISMINGDSIPEGPVHAVLATIPYGTWARGRHDRPEGPPFVRSASHPWGLPWLTGSARERLEEANTKLRSAMTLLKITNARCPSAQLTFAFPEYFGSARQGLPASPWLLPEIRRWARREGWCRYALFQCELGTERRRFPCGILTSESMSSDSCHAGWPKLRQADMKYVGPLPPSCNCGRDHGTDENHDNADDASDAILRPGFLKWWLMQVLSAGLQRTGELRRTLRAHRKVERTPSPSSGSEGDETWIESNSSISDDSGNPLKHTLDLDYALTTKLGLQDKEDQLLDKKDQLLNAADTPIKNYVNQVPIVKGAVTRHKLRCETWADRRLPPPQLLLP